MLQNLPSVAVVIGALRIKLQVTRKLFCLNNFGINFNIIEKHMRFWTPLP